MKILIVEDDPLHRSFLKETIGTGLPECSEVIEAENGYEGETLGREHKPANVIMDLQMTLRNGVEAARTMWKERPQTKILFWSNYADEAYVRGVARIVPLGAAYGYVLKSASKERLTLALRSIFVENQCVTDREVKGLQKSPSGTGGLTDSEYEVLMDVALGLTDRAIAERRKLSLRSVQNRLQQLYQKLEIHSDSGQHGGSMFNLRARAVSVATLRKLLNRDALEYSEAELNRWLTRQAQPE